MNQIVLMTGVPDSALAGAGLMDITSQAGTLSLTNTTVYNNASSLSGYHGGVMIYKSHVELQNSIVAGNTANGTPANVGNWNNGTGNITSLGHNLSNTEDWTASEGDLLNKTAIKLNALVKNDGITLNHLPPSDSLAIDAGDATICADSTYEQRGKARCRHNAV